MAHRIQRVTMFKIPEKADQDALLKQYQVLVDTHQRDGKPYIASAYIGLAEPGPLSQGYTIVSRTEFDSMADMDYYSDHCVAHQNLKAFVGTITCQGILTVFFKPSIVGGTSL